VSLRRAPRASGACEALDSSGARRAPGASGTRHALRAAAASALALCLGAAAAYDGCPPPDDAGALRALNALRQAGLACGGPAAALTWSARLAPAAALQAGHLAAGGAAQPLVHEGPRGENLRQRVAALAGPYARVAENLARGQPTADEALRAWARSPAHCANLVDPRVSEAALSCAADAEHLTVWVLVLGRP
jgi:uncharacterized protein YkwD